jgi:hypothetical protein
MVSKSESVVAESGWMTCDFKFIKQPGGTVIVDELLIVMGVNVFGHISVIGNFFGEKMIH